MSVDYNPQNKNVASKKSGSGKPANSFFGVKKTKMAGKKPGAATLRSQSVVKNGGVPTVKTIQHGNEKGLMLTQHNVPVNTKEYNNKTVWEGGGHPSTKVVQAKGKAAVAPC